jgi:hypothetical protein
LLNFGASSFFGLPLSGIGSVSLALFTRVLGFLSIDFIPSTSETPSSKASSASSKF